MKLNLIRSAEGAEKILTRIDPLDLSALPQSVLDRTHQAFGDDVTPEQSVLKMLQDVRQEGDAAVGRYSKLLDGVELSSFRVEKKQLVKAAASISAELRESLELAAERVRQFHQEVMPKDWLNKAESLGQLVRPLERVGLYAPGGTAAYPSTVLMTAIPARVAGVKEVILCTPARPGEALNLAVLAAAEISGIDAVYQIGGVPAIGAMAYGTESVPKVDKICGPGNVFVAYAKKLVQGQVDIDGVFGPTETVVIADAFADPGFCAADLIGQAEHDPLATAILITDSQDLIERIEHELEEQLNTQLRGDLAREALERQGRVVLVDSVAQAVELADLIAPEHMCLMVQDPWKWAETVKHAGGLFLGEYSPEVMGDYVAGPSHVMPTGGTARFSSALSVHQFLRTMPVVSLSPNDFQKLGPAAIEIAKAEGLGGHATAVRMRLEKLQNTDRN
ncbi:MAG: histidinol dehydrogenase [SAR202 cluster bacterium Io17-Chloro-G4]|nr:MAG: histidinol dehydrogenase [SAR202 cluster bacterium Io17-Chloro-G4]